MKPALLAATVVTLLLAAAALPGLAAVPHEAAVPAYAEEQTIRQLEQHLPEPGLADAASGIEHHDRHTLMPPGRVPEYAVILQRGGNTWRVLRNGPLAWTTALLLLAALLAIAAYHRFVGPLDSGDGAPAAGADAPAGEVLRFTRWQRWVHWAAALAFVVLAVTGLVLLFGRKLLLPWLGHEVFAWVAAIAKLAHNVAGPLFVGITLLMFFTYLRHNRFQRADWQWLRRGGGLLSHRHVPAPYFNAGEKLWFWLGVTALGLLMAATGLVLDFPYRGEVGALQGFTRYQLQWADALHVAGAALYLAAAFGHIYLGTLGSPGAWQAMWRGHVSARWAERHHRLWYEQLQRGADAPPLGRER